MLADFIHARGCKPICAKLLTLPAQERSRLQRLENRKSYYEKGDRQKRTHRLITRGAAVESIAPLAKALSETEFYAFTEKIFALPEARALLMEAVNAHNQAGQKGKG